MNLYCIADFITNVISGFAEIVLISDGCNYQNRNRVLSSELSNITVEKNINIVQLFLEKGHTMMEDDSVHSTLEALFKPPICSPEDYINICVSLGRNSLIKCFKLITPSLKTMKIKSVTSRLSGLVGELEIP
ncbi:hypothetical protein RN001_012699 [Aquatica leii]|uniref:Uncharacterized protein n=1 Tax=Aquatica leii TaxID=1421715 RepID=A0AAN7PUP9_9COLE|nr:hypothetical protein RN001_012699 [Aquatica leii]